MAEPLFQLSLFRIRAFTAGNIAAFAVAVARGGLQFVLIIWLQGIWLPLHGYSYSQTPLWAGIFLLPLTAGFLVSGPLAGTLSDRFGSRGMATAGTVVFGGSFVGLLLLPVDFPYWAFALLIAASGIGSGMFAAPNTSSIMSSVPARLRGAASGMRATFQNSGTALSIGIFFSLMIAGLTGTLSTTLTNGLQPARRARRAWPTTWARCRRWPRCSPPSSGSTRFSTCWPRAARCPRSRRRASTCSRVTPSSPS